MSTLDQYIQNFDIEKSQKFMNNNWNFPIISTGIYLLFIFLGPKFMKTRKALNIKYSLFIWNLSLSIFSYIGLILMFPTFYKSWKNIGINTICNLQLTNETKPLVVATYFFTWSKIPELVDTVFLIAKKRHVIFLHWYHHSTVLLYCWYCYTSLHPFVIIFSMMNFAVHFIMYGYYALHTIRLIPKWFPPIMITVLQIFQMIMGFLVSIYTLATYIIGYDCLDVKKMHIMVSIGIYFSYFYLFWKILQNRYFKDKPS